MDSLHGAELAPFSGCEGEGPEVGGAGWEEREGGAGGGGRSWEGSGQGPLRSQDFLAGWQGDGGESWGGELGREGAGGGLGKKEAPRGEAKPRTCEMTKQDHPEQGPPTLLPQNIMGDSLHRAASGMDTVWDAAGLRAAWEAPRAPRTLVEGVS